MLLKTSSQNSQSDRLEDIKNVAITEDLQCY